MKQLYFEDFESLVCDITDKFNSLTNEYGDITVIAKYNEVKRIIRELTYLGYSIEDIELHRPDWDNYEDEYILSLNFDGIWCSPMKRNGKYITDESEIIYILDNCSSACIPYCRGVFVYEVEIAEAEEYDTYEDENDSETEETHTYMINGKPVNKETFDNYVAKFAPAPDPDLDDEENDAPGNNDYSITVKCNLDVYEALEIIKDMERRIMNVDDMLREMDCFRRLFNW